MVYYQFFVLCAVLSFVSTSVSVTVRTHLGELIGSATPTQSGKDIFTFLGVPYARPPVGKYRFNEPKPAKRWKGTWKALDFSPECIQYNMMNPDHRQKITGNEDCLYVNIYTPSIYNTSYLPVLVFFHGGAFMFGSSRIYNPFFFLDRYDIVHVSVNYRLGPFGFLSTQDEVVPGNNGLKDQVLALKWVKENIEFFGGNPNDITISGNSAGAASVHFHYLSPLSRGLFTKGISSSGTALLSMALSEEPLEKAKILSELLGCSSESTENMIACLKERPSEQILLKMSLMLPYLPFNPMSPFGPVVEISNKNVFLPEQPYRLLTRGNTADCPWLLGVTTEEGLYPAALFADRKELLEKLNDDWATIAPYLLDFYYTAKSNETEYLRRLSDSIKEYYLGKEDISLNNRDQLIQMIGDRLFKVDSALAARLQASTMQSPVFFYTFAFRGSISLTHQLTRSKSYLGVSHFDDMNYILALPESLQLENEEDVMIIQTMTNIWGNFITSGNPSPNHNLEWTPVSQDSFVTDNLHNLQINSHRDIFMSDVKNFANSRFWHSLQLRENAYFNNEKFLNKYEL